jgi:hypothetical protein
MAVPGDEIAALRRRFEDEKVLELDALQSAEERLNAAQSELEVAKSHLVAFKALLDRSVAQPNSHSNSFSSLPPFLLFGVLVLFIYLTIQTFR